MAKQQFNIRFDFEANMNQVKTAVADLQKSLQGINLPSNLSTNFEKIFGKLNTEMTNFEALTKSSFTNMADVSKAQNAFGRIQKLLNQLGIESTKIKGLDPNKLIPSGVAKRVEDLTAKWASLDAQSKKKDGFAQKIKIQNDAIKDQEREINKLVIKRKALADQNQALGLQKGTQSGIKNSAEKELDKAVAKRSTLEGQKGGKSSAEYAALGQEITRLGKVIGAADTEITRLTTSINKNKAAMIDLDGKIDVAKQDMDGLQQELKEMQSFDIDVEELTKLRQELADILGLDLDDVSTDLEAIKKAITGIPTKELAQVAQNGERVDKAMRGVDAAADGAADGLRKVVKEGENSARAASEMENLKNQVLQFFSISNSIQLFRRAVTSAINTVKELDATMTEAAVVTDFSVGDMWERLPEYSTEANKLGVSINGMYQATTLYYQQGLKNNEAMALGVETMKMARIAGMESAEATEAMTAALRGFNMELNETSAVRVNDVYSQLAAVTAADTEQIATAMSKTASIASAANMEFEATAAFLAQIIETTQEAPETAGTALKTIIARFSEVKSLRDQGLSSGQDAEGEAIDVNKIQAALRSVGISMEGFFAGTEGLDSVLLKLAEKWDTLDFETQRYIATMAAGSRQQSRFIAMMSDYGRTTELVGAAQNSAGASQRQFAKTAESLEAKLTKLKNAWDQFVMGIANDELIKFGVDALTEILNAVNNLTKGLPGLTKSFANLGLAFGGIMLGKKAVGGLLGSVGKSLGEGMGITPKEEKLEKTSGPKIVKNAKDIKISQRSVVTDKETREQIKLMKQLNQERTDTRRQIEKVRQAMEKEGRESQELQVKLRNLQTVYQSLNAQYGVEQEVRKEMTSAYIVSGGALDKLNTEQKEALAIAIMNNRVTKEQLADMDEEALKRLLVAMGVKAEEEANEDLNEEKIKEVALNHKGILGLIEAIGLRAMGKKAIRGETMSLKALVAEKWKNVSATIAENAALIAGVAVVLAVVAAIAMLVVGLTKMNQAWKDSADNSKKIAKVNEEIAEMQDQITESKEALNKLTDSRTNLEELQNTFEGLTRGTEEWKQKLVEVNGAVLDLIQEYPVLAGYVTKGENGQLTIQAEGWDAATDGLWQQITTAMTTQTGLQMKKNYLEQQQSLANSSEYFAKQKQMQDFWKDEETKDASGWIGAGLVGGGVAAGGAALGAKIGTAIGTAAAPGIGTVIGAVAGLALGGLAGFTLGHLAPDWFDAGNGTIQDAERRATGGLTQDEFMAFAAKAQESGITYSGGATEEELKELYLQMGYDASMWSDVYEKIHQMGTEFDELANSALELRTAQDAYMTSLVSSLAVEAGVADSEYYDQITEIAAISGVDEQAEVAARAEEILADDDYTGKNGEAEDKLIEEYAAVMDMEKDAVNEKIQAGGLSAETMAHAIAQSEVNDELIAEMQRLEKVMKALPKSTEGLKNALTKEGHGLYLNNIEEFKKVIGTEDLSTITDPEAQKKAVSQYLTKQGVSMSELGLTMEADWELIWKNLVIGETGFTKAIEQFQILDTTKLPQEELELVDKQINDLIKKMNSSQAMAFSNAFALLDISNLEEIENFSELLESLVPNLPEDQLESFIETIKKIGQATKQVTAEDFTKAYRSIKKISQDFTTGQRESYLLSKEEVDSLISSGAFTKSDFFQTLSGEWAYLGGSIEKLILSLDRNTQAILKREEKELDAQIDTAEFLNIESLSKTTRSAQLAQALENNDAKAIKKIIGELQDRSLDLSGLGIGGLTNHTNLDVLSTETLKSFASQLLTVASNEKTYQEQKDEMVSEAANVGALAADTFSSLAHTGATTVEYRTGDFLKELYYWADVFHIDPSNKKYNGLNSTNPAEQQTAANLLYDDLQAVEEAWGAENSKRTAKARVWDYVFNQGRSLSSLWSDEYLPRTITLEDLENEELVRKISVAMANTDPEYLNYVMDWSAIEAAGYGIDPQSDYANLDHEGWGAFQAGSHWYLLPGYATDPRRPGMGSPLGYSFGNSWDAFGANGQNYIKGYTSLYLYDFTKEQDSALRALAQQYKVSSTILNAYVDAMENGTGEQKRMAASALAAAIEQERQAEKLGYLVQGLTTLNQKYQDIDKTAQGYREAIYRYGELLGLNMKDINNFRLVEENLALIQEAAEGSAESFQQLYINMAAAFNLKVDTSGFIDLENSNIDDGNEDFTKYLTQAYERGIYEVTEEVLTKNAQYLQPIFNEAGEFMGAQVVQGYEGQLVQMMRGQDSFQFAQVVNQSGGSSKEWENPYDKFYNTYEKINDLIREREKLEKKYDRMLKNRATSGLNLLRNSQEEIASLQAQVKLQEEIRDGKRGQIDALLKENAGLVSKYGIGIKDGVISMNWDKVDAEKGTEQGEKIEEFVSKLEEYRDQMQEAEDALWDIEDSIAEIRERGRDQYFDMEDRIKEALITERQEEIDKLSAINDSINDANSKMLDAMQQQIDEYRQSRDNKKAEDEIADKQARLAYLQQNTSGANATEILKLEKEITEAQESHIDNLIDQKINELQQQNDEAAEQRERQIQIMEAQLQQYDESGAVWNDVYRLWEDSITNEGKLIEGSPLEKLLKNTEAFESLSKLGQQEWMDNLTQSIIEGWAFVNGLSKANKGDTVNFRAANGQLVTGTANEKGDIVANGKVYGSVSTSEDYEAANHKKVSTISEILRYGMRGKNIEILQEALGNIEEAKYTAGVTGYFGEKTLAAVKRFQKEMGVPQTGNVGELTKKAFAAKQYKTGGLADYTGPAWLDGTKSKPELVLNAKDTQNFIQLKDILASLMTSTPKSAEKSGDMSFDIDINVETINDETDLDMIANYIENKIVSSANYRNNTIVGGHR